MAQSWSGNWPPRLCPSLSSCQTPANVHQSRHNLPLVYSLAALLDSKDGPLASTDSKVLLLYRGELDSSQILLTDLLTSTDFTPSLPPTYPPNKQGQHDLQASTQLCIVNFHEHDNSTACQACVSMQIDCQQAKYLECNKPNIWTVIRDTRLCCTGNCCPT